jgi:hypothetical protein
MKPNLKPGDIVVWTRPAPPNNGPAAITKGSFILAGLLQPNTKSQRMNPLAAIGYAESDYLIIVPSNELTLEEDYGR